MPLHELALRILIAAETGVISNWGIDRVLPWVYVPSEAAVRVTRRARQAAGKGASCVYPPAVSTGERPQPW
jgi:hypothetical protein